MKDERSTRPRKSERLRLLAQVHIAKKEIWPSAEMGERMYREILFFNFGARSAADLSLEELRTFRQIMEDRGWKPGKKGQKPKVKSQRLKELRAEADALLRVTFDREGRRGAGFCRKICGVDNPVWCHDVKKLAALVKALSRQCRILYGAGDA